MTTLEEAVDSDQLSLPELPEGWTWATLPQLIGPGGVFTDGDWVESKDQVQLADVGDGEYRDKSARFLTADKAEELGCTLLQAGDILIARMPDPLGRACIFPGDPKPSVTVVDVCVVRPASPCIDTMWLLHTINSEGFRQQIDVFERGTTRKRISRGNLAILKVPLPPLAEQERIAVKVGAVLARVDAARWRLTKVPAILKRFRQSVLAAACSGRLTEDWRDAQPADAAATDGADQLARLRAEHAAKGTSRSSEGRRGANAATYNGDGLDIEAMPELPETWCYGRADEVVEPGTVVTYGIVLPGPQIPKGVPYVRGLDIENGSILIDQLWRTAPEIAAKHDRSKLHPGDVLLCIIRHLKVAIVPAELDGGNLTQGTVRLRPSDAMVGEYLAKYLESEAAQEWMKRRYFGMDMPRINVEDARAIPVPLPPLPEQHEIVRRVSALFALAAKVEARLSAAVAAADRITRAVLAKAFRGELVETESARARREGRAYEPAAKLLERVRASSTASTKPNAAPASRPRRRVTANESSPC